MKTGRSWPMLRAYTGEFLSRIAFPVGGIGTGTVSLGGRGDLRDWEIMQRPSKGFAPENSFFCVYAGEPDVPDGRSYAKLLEGPMDGPLDSMNGFRARVNGLPRFREAAFSAAYPLAMIDFSDPAFPLDVWLEAFNPLIPCDADSSGIPVAILRYVLRNPTNRPVRAAVCGSLNNYIGFDGVEGGYTVNTNHMRSSGGLTGIFMQGGCCSGSPQWGTMCLALLDQGLEISGRTNWDEAAHYFASRMDFWRDFSGDGRLEAGRAAGSPNPTGSICGAALLEAGEQRAWTFLLAWHFPNRYTWTPAPSRDEKECRTADQLDAGEEEAAASTPGACPRMDADGDLLGNYYTLGYGDAWDVAQEVAGSLPELERRTCSFVKTLLDSDFPAVVKEAALFNLPSLRSQTAFRTADGNFFGWEGCNDTASCCYGMNPHVWNYEHATAFLFGKLSQSMRRVEFLHATGADGSMSYRVNLPLSRATEMGLNAADGQMGCIIKLYRDWRLSGDDGFLRELWPAARRALEFAWVPGGWDADGDGVMEGIQHNTTDLNFYGPNAMITGWYLAALEAAACMAEYLGEDDFASRCRDLFAGGKKWLSENLFNGEYFRQEIIVPPRGAPVAKGLLTEGFMKQEFDGDVPSDQPGDGCMTDQTIGQYMASVCGLGPVFEQEQLDCALDAVYRRNFLHDLWEHANPIRAFAVNDEAMVVIGTYPMGLPLKPCFRFPENWTGVEYAYAVLLMYRGQTERGLEVYRAVRERFDGRKRNPFDEPECGHHYARAMAAWSAIPALSGFRYDAVNREIHFLNPPGRAKWFWSTGHAWGDAEIRSRPIHSQVSAGDGASPVEQQGHGKDLLVRVHGGEIRVERVILDAPGGALAGIVESADGKGGKSLFRQGDEIRSCVWSTV